MYKPYLYDRTPSLPTFVKVRWGGLAQAIDFYADFTRGLYWIRGVGIVSVGQFISLAGSGTQWEANASGVYESFATTVPAIQAGMGFAILEGRTNVVTYRRDMTNAAWVKTSITAAKDQVGIDGTANGASSLTATGANGTCLQAITLSSSARYQSAFVKRLSGSGTINMTMDNGSTWTAISPTSSWQALEIPTQTLANPTVGFRIVTSGDSIAVDFVQNENGTFRTSPIHDPANLGTASARGARVPTVIGQAANVFLGAKSIYAQTNAIAGGSSSRVVEWSGGAQNLSINPTTTVRTSNAANNADATLGSGASTSRVKAAFGFDATSLTSRGNAGTIATSANAMGTLTGTAYLGNRADGLRALNGRLEEIAVSTRVKGLFDGSTA